jgi:hypothetical protein
VEPHATPAATRGPQPCPHPDHAITETDSKNDTEHKGSNTPEQSKHLKILWTLTRPFPGMRMAVRMLSADVGWTWLCETVLKIDAGAPHPRVFPPVALRARVSVSLFFQGLRGRHARQFVLVSRRIVMQVIYERCAAVDVGKDVIAVAVRRPGKGPDGRVTVRASP